MKASFYQGATAHLQRDPFARATFVRETLPTDQRAACAWCGQPGRFVYRWEPDTGRPGPWSRPMCSVGCFRAYYDQPRRGAA